MWSGGIAPPIHNSTLDGGEWSASSSRGKNLRYPLDGGGGGASARVNGWKIEKFLPFAEYRTPVVQPVTSNFTECATPANNNNNNNNNNNVKLPLCLTKHHTMKAYWGVEV
jgi:hypothetical protein